jgi:small-conductance mechanosensitive channel/CRP-like cAMP-binding protein
VAATLVVRNRVIRRRLAFSLVTLLALVAMHVLTHQDPPLVAFQSVAIERLLLAFAAINAAIALAFNPWFQDRVFDRSPAIVQDALVLVLFGAAAVFLLDDTTFLTASAIAAAAVGFALQDTLANAFAGLAIQVEKPFRVGHWIKVAGFEGTVTEVTWRATKIRTRTGDLVIVPNNTIGKEAIHNYSEPALPTRVSVEVGADYGTPPNEVRDALVAAAARAPRVLQTPAPDAIVVNFGDSAVVYQALFWIADHAQIEFAQDEVRRAIYYEFRRRNIDIPYPIQVEYSLEKTVQDAGERAERYGRAIAASPIFAGLPVDCHRALAAAAQERVYGDGEVVVRESEPGGSMFFVQRGRMAVTVGPEQRQVAVTEAGGYFGEMSLLTGEPRSATVKALGDATVLEVSGDAFGAYVRSHPEVVELLASGADARRRELDASRAEQTSAPAGSGTLVQRIRKFFRV